MKIELIIIAIFIIISLVLFILYYVSLSKLSLINNKIIYAEDSLKKELNNKIEVMKKLESQAKKYLKKKDYFKDFNELDISKENIYDLDEFLENTFIKMEELKENYEDLNNKNYNNNLLKVKEINEIITADKRYFNKNNTILLKSLKGINSLVAKINKIVVKNAFDIKKPID